MDIEKLTKHQIVLLTLLVSFVTSIATGIVTVSLMEQAPGGVTRVVNQIVEHTVETVVPSTQGAAVVSTEKTVVVKDDDLAASSIATTRKGIIRIVGKGSDTLVARGIILTKSGVALTDKASLVNVAATSFEAILPSGERVPLTVRASAATTTPFVTLDLALGSTTGKIIPVTMANVSKLSLGQSVIRIGGNGADTVGVGVVASLPTPRTAEENVLVQASISSVTPGSVLTTLFGEVIGLITQEAGTAGPDFYTVPPSDVPAVLSVPATSNS